MDARTRFYVRQLSIMVKGVAEVEFSNLVSDASPGRGIGTRTRADVRVLTPAGRVLWRGRADLANTRDQTRVARQLARLSPGRNWSRILSQAAMYGLRAILSLDVRSTTRELRPRKPGT